jgi:hypothetical protein
VNSAPTQCTRCGKPAARAGMCLPHLREAVAAWKDHTGRCESDGCNRKARARKMCKAHYEQWRRDRADAPRCSDESCDKSATVKSMCDRHYMAERRVEKGAEPRRDLAPTCVDDGCDEDAVARDRCRKHYQRWYRQQRKAAAAA